MFSQASIEVLMKDLSGKIYYGLHFQQGVAEYKDIPKEDGSPLRIFVNSETARKMDPSFAGKPIFVKHRNEVNEEEFGKAVGYVVESFFNKADGNHWAKFIITKEDGEQAIRNGWALSNAYYRNKEAVGGRWHGVDYDTQVVEGQYEHLAIVNDPRYEESKIMTPEQFKAYNSEKENELLKLANSKNEKKEKKEKKGMLHIFKKEKVENSADLENTMVTLPRSGKDMSITELVKNADEEEMKKGEEKMANGTDMVECSGKKMSVNELKEMYENMCKKSKNDDGKMAEESKSDALGNEDDDEKKHENMDDEKDHKNDESAKEKSMENEDEEEKKTENKGKKSKNSSGGNFEALKNAPQSQPQKLSNGFGFDGVSRGKSRYGS
jgi:hypothetical protein